MTAILRNPISSTFHEPKEHQGVVDAGIEAHLASIAESLSRIAEAVAPAPADIVGSEYIAQHLGCTTTWIADQTRRGIIPSNCIVPGTGNGKLWKFYRARIDAWLGSR